MRKTALFATFIIALGTGTVSAQTPAARKLQLSFDADHSVNLAAQNVTPREILAEWARLCGCFIVNAERLVGAPIAVPIEFAHASQARVLQALLRQAAGYVLTPQRPGHTSASLYETIYILPTGQSTAPPVTYSYTGTSSVPIPAPTQGSPDDETAPIQPIVRTPLPGGQPPAIPGGPTAPGTPQQPASTPPTTPGGLLPSTVVPVVPVGAPAPGTVPPGTVPGRPAVPGTPTPGAPTPVGRGQGGD